MKKVDKKSEWILDNGDVVFSTEITEDHATAEYIEINGEKICVKAEVTIMTSEWSTVTFWLWGLQEPKLRACHTTLTTTIEFVSDRDAAIMFGREFGKYLRRDEFNGEAGKLLKSRIGACLNYQWSFNA